MVSFAKSTGLTYDDVLISNLGFSSVRSRTACSPGVSVPYGNGRGEHTFAIPIISSNMDTITGLKMAVKMAELGGLGIIHRGELQPEQACAAIREWKSLVGTAPIALSVGSISIQRERERLQIILDALKRNGFDHSDAIICVDLANGNSENGRDTVEAVRSQFAGMIIAGSVCNQDGGARLRNAGADMIRCGIGGGGACKTRVATGCGTPQLTAVIDTADGGDDVIADGGIKKGGDVAKALAAGAKMVMIGGLLAGTDFTPGWTEGGETSFRGMASNQAKNAVGIPSGFEEGIAVQVKCKERGSTVKAIGDLVDGVVSAMSYTNCLTLRDFALNAEFIRITPAAIAEGIPHYSQQ